MTKPYSPTEAALAKQTVLPAAVINAVNELLAKNYDGQRAVIKQKDIVGTIISQLDTTEREMLAKNWLNIEPLYELYGWKVSYDKPGYNESYDATFTFERKA